MPPKLYHVSEQAVIARFDPRPPPATNPAAPQEHVVWAVDEDHLVNYLLPRDCPRVIARPGPRTTPGDLRRFFPRGESCVIAVETAWRARIAACRLFLYRLPGQTFRLADATAGYHVSRQPVIPLEVTALTGLAEAIGARNATLEYRDDLWPLHDAIAASSLDFSMIRMRNAVPRAAAVSSG